MSYYNQQQPPVGVPPPPGFPPEGYPKDAYPPPGYPNPPPYDAQYAQPQLPQKEKSTGCLEGCLDALCCCCRLDACF
ncbi:cysteine-rich and transmembrane domain-containing protein WIH2-like [Durio zibethinus]|uniref:Cysteine-rich and transmembrane domain-containing protein WIH2-like n=1 Tax=Durio zibethinus TaxID=66656 RepID=A0A6P5Z9M8_DURZI|nr:cysteine-rich and transmembrane domain-containing protein WIH2-like [Durio zibethinus]